MVTFEVGTEKCKIKRCKLVFALLVLLFSFQAKFVFRMENNVLPTKLTLIKLQRRNRLLHRNEIPL